MNLFKKAKISGSKEGYKLKMKNLSGSEKIMEERDKKLDQLGI